MYRTTRAWEQRGGKRADGIGFRLVSFDRTMVETWVETSSTSPSRGVKFTISTYVFPADKASEILRDTLRNASSTSVSCTWGQHRSIFFRDVCLVLSVLAAQLTI